MSLVNDIEALKGKVVDEAFQTSEGWIVIDFTDESRLAFTWDALKINIAEEA